MFELNKHYRAMAIKTTPKVVRIIRMGRGKELFIFRLNILYSRACFQKTRWSNRIWPKIAEESRWIHLSGGGEIDNLACLVDIEKWKHLFQEWHCKSELFFCVCTKAFLIWNIFFVITYKKFFDKDNMHQKRQKKVKKVLAYPSIQPSL